MKPVTIRSFVMLATFLSTAGSATAGPYGVSPVQVDALRANAVQIDHRPGLGAPLYAGSGVIIIDRGYDRRRYGYNPRNQRHHRYSQPRYRGHRHDRGYRGHRYGRWDPYYNPNPYRSYGNERWYPPRYGAAPPRRHDRYGGDRGYGGNRGYGRERYDRGPRLTILGASYRSVDGRACSAFSHVHKRCDGQRSCSVKASNSICGDPDRGRLKVLEVAYACGNQERRARVPEKSRSQLRCR